MEGYGLAPQNEWHSMAGGGVSDKIKYVGEHYTIV